MNTNWNRLKRQIQEDKHESQDGMKRRRLNRNRQRNNSWDKKKTAKPKQPALLATKYVNSNSNSNAAASNSRSNPFDAQIERYRENKSQADLFECIDLLPPPSTNGDMEQRKAFWNDLRLKLRARLPQKFLFKLLPSNSAARNDDDDNSKHKLSPKLHRALPDAQHTDCVAMDCEMVGIGAEGRTSILARVSIVNYFGDVLYDQFVQPINDAQCRKITDFRKQFTGIDKRDLVKFGIPFKQCQRELIEILKGKKLIGHGIDNDFAVIHCKQILKQNYFAVHANNANNANQAKAVASKEEEEEDEKMSKRQLRRMQRKKYSEPFYFDTAACELLHDDLQRPRSLKFLLELFLGIHIQNEAHDSVIDAISTMAVYRAVAPEIKDLHVTRKQEERKIVEDKREFAEKRKRQYEHQEVVGRHASIINNYAYNNELDRMIAQFKQNSDVVKGNDNFEKQMLASNRNPYKNDQ